MAKFKFFYCPDFLGSRILEREQRMVNYDVATFVDVRKNVRRVLTQELRKLLNNRHWQRESFIGTTYEMKLRTGATVAAVVAGLSIIPNARAIEVWITHPDCVPEILESLKVTT